MQSRPMDWQATTAQEAVPRLRAEPAQAIRVAHIGYIHRTRAIAILFIVAMHCVDELDWSQSRQTYRFMVELFQGATVDFVMISGFLFQHLSAKYNFAGYLQTKFRNVILPYLLVGLPGIVLLLSKPDFLLQNPEMRGTPMWEQAAFLYFYGGSQLNHVLWFIPVLTIYFLLAPLFIHFLKRPAWFLLLVVLIPISVFAHRPAIQKYHHLQLALYFLSAYMSGMLVGLYRDKAMAFAQKYFVALLAAVAAIALGHFLLTDDVGTYVEEIFSRERGLVDWIFVQKFLFFFVLIALMKKLESLSMRSIDYIATVSFAIFFLHIYVLHVYSHLVHWHQFPGTVLATLGLTVLAIGCSVALAWGARCVFGKSSRLLIGA
jgi:peptidoglycan/LPS O-acetylase OafA/YrhL